MDYDDEETYLMTPFTLTRGAERNEVEQDDDIIDDILHDLRDAIVEHICRHLNIKELDDYLVNLEYFECTIPEEPNVKVDYQLPELATQIDGENYYVSFEKLRNKTF
jgi:hypothetical protein